MSDLLRADILRRRLMNKAGEESGSPISYEMNLTMTAPSRMFQLLVMLCIAVPVLLAGCHRDSPPKLQETNVVVIVVDTLRADFLGLYNPEIATTPNIDRIGREGVVFERAYSAAPWTKPAITSLLTSLYPSEHKVIGINSVKDQNLVTITERLHDRGFETHGIVSHTLIDKKNGFGDGFDTYELVPFRGNVHDSITADTVSDHALQVLQDFSERKKSGAAKGNLFLFLHYFDPHFNYQHHKKFDLTSGYTGKLYSGIPFRKLRNMIPRLDEHDRKYLEGLYREEIAFTDYEIGRVLDAIQAGPLKDNTLVIFTADHGEEFLDHGGIGHTRTLFDELVRVPLLFSYPGKFKVNRFSQPVSTMDIVPTLLALDQSQELPSELRGESLVPALLGQVLPPAGRKIFSEVEYKSSGIQANKIGVVIDRKKGVLDELHHSFSLYDLTADPKEQNDISQNDLEVAQFFQGLVEKYREEFRSSSSDHKAPEIERSPEEVEQLKSLGYM